MANKKSVKGKKSQIRVIGIFLFVVLLSVIAFAFSITEEDNKTIIQTENSSLEINLSSYFSISSQYYLEITGDLDAEVQGDILLITNLKRNSSILVIAYYSEGNLTREFEIIYEESIEENLTSISNNGGGF